MKIIALAFTLFTFASLAQYSPTYKIEITKIEAVDFSNTQVYYSLIGEKPDLLRAIFICDEFMPENDLSESEFGVAYLDQGKYTQVDDDTWSKDVTKISYNKAGECKKVIEGIQEKLKKGMVTIQFDNKNILEIRNK